MSAAPPEGATLAELKEAARACTACELAGPATQTVFGRGPVDARMMLIGEQPGDVQDHKGLPFGIQIVGQRYEDDRLLACARWIWEKIGAPEMVGYAVR